MMWQNQSNMQKKKSFRSASKESYIQFCLENPTLSVSFTQFRKIMYDYNRLVVEHMIETGEGLRLPYGLGYIRLYRKKTSYFGKKPYKADGKLTRVKGKPVYHLNLHTDGYFAYYGWMPRTAMFPTATCFRCRFSRNNTRYLASVLLQNPSKMADFVNYVKGHHYGGYYKLSQKLT